MNLRTIIKTIKIQLKPNNKQHTKLHASSGVARWAYNWALSRQQESYSNGGKFISDSNLRKELTQLKKTDQYKWLYNYSNNIPKQAIKDACMAYKSFFKKQTKFPKMKSKKRSKPSFYNDNVKIKFSSTHVHLEKIGKVKMSEFNRIPTSGKYYNPRVTFNGLNWWLSVGVEMTVETDSYEASAPIGIDLGIKDLATMSNGDTYENINKRQDMKYLSKKMKRLQRKIHKKYQLNKIGANFNKTKNIVKLEKKWLKVIKRLTNIRNNYIHHITTNLVKTKPEYIVVEDLNVSGLLKNKYLAKSVQEQKLSEFVSILEYKCRWNSITLIKCDRWFPSSKLCSNCGEIKKGLKLSERVYRCDCGLNIDRDLNAAINLREYGKLV